MRRPSSRPPDLPPPVWLSQSLCEDSIKNGFAPSSRVPRCRSGYAGAQSDYRARWGSRWGFCRDAVTGLRQVFSGPGVARSAATVGVIVKSPGTIPRTPVRAVIALAVVFWLAAAGGLWDQSRADVAPAHAPHALGSDWSAEFGALADHQHPVVSHPHAQDGSNTAAPESVGAAVMRRASTGVAALGLFVIALMLAPLWCQMRRAAVRGPPRVDVPVFSGRAILTRLCIARR